MSIDRSFRRLAFAPGSSIGASRANGKSSLQISLSPGPSPPSATGSVTRCATALLAAPHLALRVEGSKNSYMDQCTVGAVALRGARGERPPQRPAKKLEDAPIFPSSFAL